MSQEEQNPVQKVPPELWNTIFTAVRDNNTTRERFRRAGNVTGVLFTCRSFHDIGLPLAYERICLDGGDSGKTFGLIGALEVDERKRRSVRELSLVSWNDSGLNSVQPGVSERVTRRFRAMEGIVQQLTSLRIVHASQMRLSLDTLEHIINVPSLRELRLCIVELPNDLRFRNMDLSSARVTDLQILEPTSSLPLFFESHLTDGLALLRIKTLRELTLPHDTIVQHYGSFRRLYSAALPLRVTKLHLITSAPWRNHVYDPAFANDLLQDCPDVEELEVQGRPSFIVGVPGLLKLKRFRGSAEAVLVFCQGKPVEDMMVGPFDNTTEAVDLAQIICCSSTALRQLKIWGIVWNPQIINAIASLCSELEVLEVIASQEKPIDLSSLALLLKPFIHLNRLRLEGRKILGQIKFERRILQQLAKERVCPRLKEAQFHEERYWGRKGSDCSWGIFRLSPEIRERAHEEFGGTPVDPLHELSLWSQVYFTESF